jgi:hypothetical protein
MTATERAAWSCKVGFPQVGAGCLAVLAPENAEVDGYRRDRGGPAFDG